MAVTMLLPAMFGVNYYSEVPVMAATTDGTTAAAKAQGISAAGDSGLEAKPACASSKKVEETKEVPTFKTA